MYDTDVGVVLPLLQTVVLSISLKCTVNSDGIEHLNSSLRNSEPVM